MKTTRLFAFITAALIVGLFAARWGAAQSTRQPSPGDSKTDYAFGLRELESFVSHLQDTKQTNTLRRFNDYSNATIVSQQSADLGVTVAILQRLRDGRTNEVIELLEGRVSSDIIGMVASYRELPDSIREKVSLKSLEHARDYRTKFPFKHRYASVDEGVADALKILDKRPTR
jgi:hypothetical protein